MCMHMSLYLWSFSHGVCMPLFANCKVLSANKANKLKEGTVLPSHLMLLASSSTGQGEWAHLSQMNVWEFTCTNPTYTTDTPHTHTHHIHTHNARTPTRSMRGDYMVQGTSECVSLCLWPGCTHVCMWLIVCSLTQVAPCRLLTSLFIKKSQLAPSLSSPLLYHGISRVPLHYYWCSRDLDMGGCEGVCSVACTCVCEPVRVISANM